MTAYALDIIWLQSLADDIKAIHTEGVFNARWELIACYHAIGRRIVTDKNWQKWDRGNEDKLSHVTELTGIATRDLRRAVQFYEKYPELEKLPDGKNISWHKIVNNLLPNGQHEQKEQVECECPNCGHVHKDRR